MNICLLQFIEMNVNSIPIHPAGVGGKTSRDPTGQWHGWQNPGSIIYEFYGLQQIS